VSPLHGRARGAQVPERPTSPPEPPPPPGPAGASYEPVDPARWEAVLRLVEMDRRKAAAFDDLAQWITTQAGNAEYTDAMGPEWVVSTIKSRVGTLIEDGRDFRAGRRRPAWLRRGGW
jgi:hypothetical protein